MEAETVANDLGGGHLTLDAEAVICIGIQFLAEETGHEVGKVLVLRFIYARQPHPNLLEIVEVIE
eukprot:CAMPEP_0170550758 /NCGR_PEP_ID=MMETSP0211-20121228/8771_1 /TAXON_ID=311385 /ORGANISM="Pseudokeronopsis sp., Strain OXSARD2" /LENGTH=64 /DNA_ID=CAMNT_0010857481 /DNA_START=234 /DNA_END=428 /DNA_ORIENTATION=+